jgi:hypothetical protein
VTPQASRAAESERQHKGWGIVLVFLALHAVIGAKLSTLGPRREATIGDPMSLWGGLFFVLWGAACLAARRVEDRSILFRVLNGTKSASFLGWVFLVLAAFLLGRYVGMV